MIVSIERPIGPNLTCARVKFKGEVDQLIWRRIDAVAEQKSYVGKYFEKEIKSLSSLEYVPKFGNLHYCLVLLSFVQIRGDDGANQH